MCIRDRTEEELMERTRVILNRCKEHNITISRKKLELGTELGFAGHIVSHNGIRPDDDKYKAIKEFPTPKNLKDLRSFLGLANQLAAFVPDLAHMSAGLRPLLKKGNAWVWEKEHEEEFSKIKNLLTSPTIAKPFDDAFRYMDRSQTASRHLRQSSSGTRKRTSHENEGKDNPLHIQNNLGGWENSLHSRRAIEISRLWSG